MSDPWLTIIGIGEDGLAGLSEASRKALATAETIFGGERHLALAEIGSRGRPWPVPFDADVVLGCRGRPTAVLASGDPFWHGVGGTLAEKLEAGEWIAIVIKNSQRFCGTHCISVKIGKHLLAAFKA